MEIGFIGLGRMGAPMARNLLKAGHAVRAHDLRREAGASVIAAGARWAESPREAASRADVVVTSLPGPKEVEAVMHGPAGVVSGASDGLLAIETSTIGPAQSRALAAEFAARGAAYVDATVNRIGMSNVEEGDLTIMVGGEAAAFERARPILACLGRRIHHMGPTGSGNATKLLNQLIFLSYVAVFCEGLALGERLGMKLETLLEVFATSAAGHRMIEDKYGQIRSGDETPGFAIHRVIKDLELAEAMRAEEGGTAPSFAAALATYRDAAARGLDDRDMTAIHRLLRDAETAG